MWESNPPHPRYEGGLPPRDIRHVSLPNRITVLPHFACTGEADRELHGGGIQDLNLLTLAYEAKWDTYPPPAIFD